MFFGKGGGPWGRFRGGVGGVHPSLLAGSRVGGGGGRRLPEVTTVARAGRGFREELLDAT